MPVVIDGRLMSPPPLPPADKPTLPTPSTATKNLPSQGIHKSHDPSSQGVQLDIHGDTTGKPMVPIPVSTPQPPAKAPKEGEGMCLKPCFYGRSYRVRTHSSLSACTGSYFHRKTIIVYSQRRCA